MTLLDNAAGDLNGAPGVIRWTGTTGAWSFDLTGTDSDTLGPDLNAVLSSTGSGTLTVWLTQIGNVGSFPPGFRMTLDGTIANGTVTYSAADCPLNMPFHMPPQGVSVTIANLGPFGPGAFSGVTQGAGSLAATQLYSVTQRLVFTASGAATSNEDAGLQAVPEPGSMILLGTGLLGLAITARRRRARNEQGQRTDCPERPSPSLVTEADVPKPT